jgi:hypothetical protein
MSSPIYMGRADPDRSRSDYSDYYPAYAEYFLASES